jgi:hypothetical protein
LLVGRTGVPKTVPRCGQTSEHGSFEARETVQDCVLRAIPATFSKRFVASWMRPISTAFHVTAET